MTPSLCRFGGKSEVSTVKEDTATNEEPNGHDGYGTVKQFEQHWTTFFTGCPDVFELQRGLNNCFNYDLVPPSIVIEAALLASRRLNCFATGVRVFGALKGKVASEEQYEQYKEHFKPLLEASGLCTPENLGRFD
jgi:cytochrome c oxidase subunit 5a